MNIEQQYLKMLSLVLKEGILCENRTGTNAITYPHYMLSHDMSEGFPLLTTKKVSLKNVAVELEFFIKGLTDKKWLQDRGCHIWDEWCNPQKIDKDSCNTNIKLQQEKENDLGKIYGYQWRNFNSSDLDQLKIVVDKIKNNPRDRRMIVSAWNPIEFDEMALPPCHILWNVTVIGDKLNLCWYQRSCDSFLGIPYNIASYALLLKLLAKEGGYKEGKLTGFLNDVHIYENHIEQVNIQLSRERFDLCDVNILNFKNVYEWVYTDLEILNYVSHSAIKAPIAI